MCGHSSADSKCHIALCTTKGEPVFPPSIVLPHSAYFFRYTSLGSTFNTFRNPALLIEPQASSREYKIRAGYII